jgi:hypothetical protein
MNATPAVGQVTDTAAHDEGEVVGLATSANLTVDTIPVMYMKASSSRRYHYCWLWESLSEEQVLIEMRASTMLPLDTA